MNAALFASSFHPHFGGVEELCRQLALEYRRRDIGVAVFTNRWPRDLPEFERVDGIPVHRLAMRLPVGVKAAINYALTSGAIRRRMLGLLREFKADVLHVQCVSCNAAYAIVAKRALGLPLVVTLQGELGMDAGGLFQRSAYARELMRRSLREADLITACSRQTLTEAEAFFGSPFKDRGRVIYNGISLDEADRCDAYSHPRPYILAIGRHVPQKGFDVLLKAMALAGDLGHDLLLAGDGIEHERLKALSATLGLSNTVHFFGRVDHAKAMALFHGCSFFVLPSLHEPLGIVNLEAMAASKAVLASDVGGVSEIVAAGVTGLLAPGGDVQKLSEGLRSLSRDASLRHRLGTVGRQRAEEFDWSNIADQYLSAYEAAMNLTSAILV